jgi:DNA-binding LacI/PurR family transcriptional regulator/signal transduction histidine kinase
MSDTNSSITFGILTDYVADYHRQILNGIQSTLEQAGLNSIVFVGTDLDSKNLPESADRLFIEANAAYDLISPRLNGLIALAGSMGPTLSDDQLLGFFARFAPLPLVSVGRVLPGIPSVIAHSSSGMRALMRHLILDCGYRRFAFMRGFVGEPDSDAREQAFRDALLEHHLEVRESDLLTGDYYSHRAHEVTRDWLLGDQTGDHANAGKPIVDVIVSASDDMAFGILRALEEAGVNVPEDVAVTGYDDIELARTSLPPLTTVRQPLFELGVQAAHLLLERWRNGSLDPAGQVFDLPSTLVLRESTQATLAAHTRNTAALEQQDLNGLETLRDQFRHSIQNPTETGQSFLRSWRDWMRATKTPERGPRHWQDMLGGLLAEIPTQLEPEAARQAMSLWGRAHALTLNEAQAARQHQQLLNEHSGLGWFHDLDFVLMSEASIPAVIRNLIPFLPQLGLSRLQVALFEQPCATISETAHLVLDYRHGLAQDFDGNPFPTSNLLPASMPSGFHGHQYLQPLFVNDQQYGWMIFEIADRHWFSFEAMYQTLSNAIHNAEQAKRLQDYTQRLEERIEERTEELVKQAALTLENAGLNTQLREQLARVEHSQRLAVEAEERTRREIAEFLHGQVQTRLLLAWNQLSDYPDLPDQAARAALVKNVCEDLERIRETDVRQASHVLHPTVIRMGLVSACRSLASRIAEVLPVKIEVAPEFQSLDLIGKSQLPEDVRLIAYRVIEEAIGNTLRHANATRVTLRFSRIARDAFEVVIQDDGCGFDPSLPHAGLGFASIDARVHAVRGTWQVVSRIDGPTKLVVRLPLEPNESLRSVNHVDDSHS